MIIRAAGPDDAHALWALLAPVFRAGDTYAIDPCIDRAGALAFWQAPEKTAFIAQDDTVLGTYYIKPNQGGGGAHVCNCGYITAKAAKGRGVARAMLAHSLETARSMGFVAMQYNFVVASNTRAIEIWERAGFRTVGRLPAAFEHPEQGRVDALIMWKDL
ncbi:MAG: N-acetyltransferase [Pseudomonadota bacterium]